MVSIRCSDWDLWKLPLRFITLFGKLGCVHRSWCWFDVAFYQHWVGSHNYLDRTSPSAFTCTSASTSSSLQKMWIGRSFPKGVLTWAYSMFLTFSYTLLEHTSILMNVDMIWNVVSRWCSFTSMAVPLRFNTCNGNPCSLHWSTLPSLYPNLVLWTDWWHFLFVFTQPFLMAFLLFFGNFVWKF